MKTESASPVVAKLSDASGGRRALHTWSESTSRAIIGFGAAASHTSRNIPDLQARAFATASPATTSSALGVIHAPKRPPMAPQRLVLRGDPVVLRQLRAAEMIAWEDSGPKAMSEPNASVSRLPFSSLFVSKIEAALFLILGAAAAAGVMIGLDDLYALLFNWTRLSSWIETLI